MLPLWIRYRLPSLAFLLCAGLPSLSPVLAADRAAFSINGNTFYAPSACEIPIRRLSERMYSYAGAAYDNNEAYAAGAHAAMQAILGAIAPESECYAWVYGAEVILALNAYNRFANDRAASLIEIALPLYYAGKFVPLTEKLRRTWGGEWEKPKRIMGAYECESTAIYFDPTLRPYDLGAVIAHELDHFMRDKFTFWDLDPSLYSDAAASLLLDELLASLHAGYLELSFQRDMLEKDADRVSPGFLSFHGAHFIFNKRRAYRLGGDLDLFKKGGHLYELWAASVRANRVKPGALFSDFFEIGVFPDFSEDFRSGKGRHWGPIFDLVKRNYFDGAGPAKAAVSALLESWHETDPALVVPSGALLRKTAEAAAAGDPGAWQGFRERFQSRLNGVSPGCRSLKAAIREGRGEGYVGAQLGSAPAGGEGHRPTIPLTPCLFPAEGL